MTATRTDCLVIGAGVAGAVYALQAARAGLHVTLITGAPELQASNSRWAQGGIIFDEMDGDLLRADIDAASSHSANPVAVDAVVEDGPRVVRELLIDDLQVAFDRDTDGSLKFTREAAHSRDRIIYAKDHTGRAILGALHARLKELAAAGPLPAGGSLTLATGNFAVDLLTLSHSSVDFLDRYHPLSCIGAYVLDVAKGQVRAVVAKKTVLATGGLGQIYLHSTNDRGAFGHGIAMAYRVGARVIDLEYVQFHPTVFYRPGERPFLVSEAVRGEGGVLINHAGTAFMDSYHPLGSLAPRDVISRSIHSELLKSASDSVYIDLSGVDADYIRSRFPPSTRACWRRAWTWPGSRSRWYRRPTTPAAAFTPTWPATPTSPTSAPSGRPPAPACTAPTGWPAPRCWSAWSWASTRRGNTRRRLPAAPSSTYPRYYPGSCRRPSPTTS